MTRKSPKRLVYQRLLVRLYRLVSSQHRITLFIFLGGLVAASHSFGQQAFRDLPLCPQPGDRCDNSRKTFRPYEMPFRLPRTLAANALYESAPFYAVILRVEKDTPCDGGEFSKAGESFRKRAQRQFPGDRVFASYPCPDMGAVYYNRVGPSPGAESLPSFVAVYARTTQNAAQSAFRRVRRLYPNAMLWRLRVGFSRIEQSCKDSGPYPRAAGDF